MSGVSKNSWGFNEVEPKMSKVKYYLVNAFFSALIGAAVELVFMVIAGQSSIQVGDLLESMAVGAAIGTVSMVYITCFLLTRKSFDTPVPIYLSNFLVVAAMFLIVYFYFYLRTGYASHINKWFIGWLVAEVLSFLLAMAWYQNMKALNQRLTKKKESLPSE
jgi:H+/Cl- antiporter ClcA